MRRLGTTVLGAVLLAAFLWLLLGAMAGRGYFAGFMYSNQSKLESIGVENVQQAFGSKPTDYSYSGDYGPSCRLTVTLSPDGSRLESSVLTPVDPIEYRRWQRDNEGATRFPDTPESRRFKRNLPFREFATQLYEQNNSYCQTAPFKPGGGN